MNSGTTPALQSAAEGPSPVTVPTRVSTGAANSFTRERSSGGPVQSLGQPGASLLLLNSLDYHGNTMQPVPANGQPNNGSMTQPFTGNAREQNPTGSPDTEVFTPSFWRMDSRLLFAHSTLQWFTNAIWAFLIWRKLDDRLDCSWWAVFAPTLVNHFLYIPMSIVVMLMAEYFVYRQIGPPPPLHASSGLTFAYALIHHVRVRSHRVDWANNALESVGLLVAKCLFCDALQRDDLGSTPLRLIFTPVWVVWPLTMALQCLKARGECFLGFLRRHMFFLLLVLIACKADGVAVSSWDVVFMGPFWWCIGMVALACALLGLLVTQTCEPFRAPPSTLVVEAGLLGVLLAGAIPHMMAIRALQKRVEGVTVVKYGSVLVPISLSWLLMWLTSLGMVAGLRMREVVAARLMALGRVWTADEGVARRLGGPAAGLDWREAQRKVDKMSEEEITRLVQSMMAGKTKPGQLKRVGENLYKRIASQDEAQAQPEQAAQVADPAASGGSEGEAPAAPNLPGTLDTPGAPASGRPGAAPPASGTASGNAVAASASPGNLNMSLRSFSSSSGHGARGDGVRDRAALVAAALAGGGAAGAAAAPVAPQRGPSGAGMAPLGGISLGSSSGGGWSISGMRHNRIVPTTSTTTASSGRTTAVVGVAAAAAGPPASGERADEGDPGVQAPGPAPPAAAIAMAPAAGGVVQGESAGGWAAVGSARRLSPSASSRSRQAEVAGTVPNPAGAQQPPSRQPTAARRSPAALRAEEGDAAAGLSPDSDGPQGESINGVTGAGASGGEDSSAAAKDSEGDGGGGPHGQGRPASGVRTLRPTYATAGGSAGGATGGSDPSPAALSGEICAVEGGNADGAGGAAPAAGSGGDEAVDGAGGAGHSDSSTCVICYDAEASCVFLECGHGGFCRRCAFLLFVRPPNECPTCRSVIDQVVEIEGPAPVGQVARVK